MANDKRYLYIHLRVYQGELEHDHRVLYITKANNLDFAAERYVSTFYPGAELDKGTSGWDYGHSVGKLISYTELTKEEYDYLDNLFYY